MTEYNEQTHSIYEENYQRSICHKCGQVNADTSQCKNSILCNKCREEQIHYPIPKIFAILAIGLIILIGISFLKFPKVFNSYKIYSAAEDNAKKGEVNSTLKNLQNVLEEYPDSLDTAVKIIEIAMENGKYNYAGYIIDTYLSGKEADNSTYTLITEYTKYLDSYYKTYDAFGNIVSNLDENASPNEKNQLISNNLKILLNDKSQNKSLLYYYLGSTSNDNNAAKEYLSKSIQEDNNITDSKIQLANILRREKDFNSAREKFNTVLNKENDNAGALRGLAIVEMLEGNKQEGVNLAKKAYDADPQETYVLETLIIALITNGQDDEAEKYKEEYTSNGDGFDDDIMKFLDGNITIDDYYLG
ncbi:hypothetical protein [Clostridium sp. ZBS15]|uniref:tetratricopeptide repeat protein n=1 Tax=Clostridium sp. ZBS15 TaxID=2949969 RepID=UPI00207A5180|nr:hypothetical protein [Clostridium sp. ZBS15]